MTPQERQDWWARTVAALTQRDPRVHLALLTCLILRNGELQEGKPGHVKVKIRITLEELYNIVNQYHFGASTPEPGVVELEAVSKGDVDGQPLNPGQSGPSPFRVR